MPVQAFQVREDRNLAFGEDTLDQAAPAAWHDDVHVFAHGQQNADGGAVGGRQPLHRFARQAGLAQALLQAVQDRPGGMEALRTAAQDRGVARLEAQPAGIGGHVGAALVDDADDPQRNRDPGDLEAVGPLPFAERAPDRVREGGDLLQPRGHGLDALRVELQAVEQRRREPLGAGRGHVALVRVENSRLPFADHGGGGLEGAGLGFAVCQGQLACRGPGCAAEVRHVGGQVGGQLVLQGHGPGFCRSAHVVLPRVNTRSSLWISSSRPRYPRSASISRLLCPRMRAASAAE
jgi:hypothetical protein